MYVIGDLSLSNLYAKLCCLIKLDAYRFRDRKSNQAYNEIVTIGCREILRSPDFTMTTRLPLKVRSVMQSHV